MVLPLKKVDRVVYEIPKGTKSCMKVPARIYANETLLKKMETDRTLDQAANVACLPGIVKYSFVMPDGHQGYGFPIGGVAAFDPDEGGVISPGGVGYDINCLPPGTKVLTPLGYRLNIEDLRKENIVAVIDKSKGIIKETSILLFIHKHEKRLYKIKTKSGYVLRLSADHPILIKGKGMVKAEELEEGMKVALYPFSGVDYEKPKEFTIIKESEVSTNIRKELRKRNLLPLTSLNPKLPFLLKILGYALGDGVINGKQLRLYGKKEDLEEMKKDMERIGYRASISSRKRKHRVGKYVFNRVEYYLTVSAKSFTELLYRLGYPKGKKSEVKYYVPQFIFKLPLWMKRLFLAAYFGAELSKPKTINGYNFYMPELKVVKIKPLSENGKVFLKDLKKLIEEFDVKTTISKAYETEDKVCWRLLVKSEPTNLIKLYSRIGYEYNVERRKLSLAAIVYLKLKMRILEERRILRKIIKKEYVKGKPLTLVVKIYSNKVNQGFIERSIYEEIENVRIPMNFATFEEFVTKNSMGEVVFDEIEEIKVEKYNGPVYDITVSDEHHNFVANCFVVSNCGVRLIRTNLMFEDLKPKLRTLLDALNRNVPSGVGRGGRLRITISELNKVLLEGINWAIDRGYAWPEDREHVEERGCMGSADPDKVSQRAKQRGTPQLGSLGSGNHFLELQVVEKIYDRNVAKKIGIFNEGQIVVMVHSGSRGLGHQVASDYIHIMERAMRKYGIHVPDRELVSVPWNTREAQDYFAAMSSAVNYAFTNRTLITYWVRESFKQVFHEDYDKLGLELIYDVAHNIAKVEEHNVDGGRKKLIVHRKGSTRAFPPGHPEIPADHKDIGQIVLIPGSMGTSSYVLLGVKTGKEAFYSTCHGSGRLLSRAEATRRYRATEIIDALRKMGIEVRAASKRVVSEEAPGAYKPSDAVVKVVHEAGLSRILLKLRPLGVVKG